MLQNFRLWLADKLDPDTSEYLEKLEELNDDLADRVESILQDVDELKEQQGKREVVENADRWTYERVNFQREMLLELIRKTPTDATKTRSATWDGFAVLAAKLALSVYPLPEPECDCEECTGCMADFDVDDLE